MREIPDSAMPVLAYPIDYTLLLQRITFDSIHYDMVVIDIMDYHEG